MVSNMKNKGFSLVELIVVIAIMAILVGVAVPVYSGYIDKAKEAKDAEYLANLSKTAQLFAAEKGLVLESIWVAPEVLEDKGVELVLQGGEVYSGDMSEFYAMLGAYDFETIETDTPVYFDPSVEETVEGHTHTEGEVVNSTCMSNGYTICGDATCGKKYNIQPRSGHTVHEEKIGNLIVKRCEHCDYVEVTFEGDKIGS